MTTLAIIMLLSLLRLSQPDVNVAHTDACQCNKCTIDYTRPHFATYQTTSLSENPKILLIKGLLTKDEIDHVLQISEGRFKQSGIVTDKGLNEPSSARTSTTCMLLKNETAMVTNIENKLCAMVGKTSRELEPLQLVKYEVGEEYKPHYDYFPSGSPGSLSAIGNQGQRSMTFFVYLQKPEAGGQTFFPKLDLKISPEPGDAIFWFDLDENAKENPLTEHGGLPVEKGTKIAMNVWFREPCTTSKYF